MPIMEVTASCGFQSPPHFSKCYRRQFGRPPSAERRGQGSSDVSAPAAR
ncbi:MAG: helix-turn-helix domain-containing protein [Nevskiaceae bacterium]